MAEETVITDQPTVSETPTRSGGSLNVLLWTVTGGILLQAILAGMFISATAETRLLHLIVGSLLPWLAIAPATVALINRRRLSPSIVTGSVLLPVGLWVQEALGHMPFAVSTAVHVPVGGMLFAGSLMLALASRRT